MELTDKLRRLAEFCDRASSASDGERLLSVAVATARQVFACRSVAAVMVAEETGTLTLKSSAGLSEPIARTWRKPVGTALAAEVLWAGSTLLYEKLDAGSPEAAELKLEFEPVALMCVRLAVDNRSIGFLLCESDRVGAFVEEDLNLLKVMADACATAIDRTFLQGISRKLTMLDPLTQIYSYAYFHRRFGEEVERATRLNESLSVILLDVDNLREFREANGWQDTERALRDIVKLVTSSVRSIDVVGRYGTDEVILYLPETPRDRAMIAAERIRGLIEKTPQPAGSPPLTASVGVASLPENGDTVNRLLDSVMTALLAAQRAGRNRVVAASMPG